ncbi:MAG: chalcone isomerase family protein [Bacteroidetes bacterium]|nr:chalcone isomerase family protein [Bacteroidota bacterium]
MRLLMTILLAAFMFQSQAQVTLNDVTLPAKLSYDNQSLSLNGGGIRTKLIFKLYTAGLYLQSKSSDGAAILKADQPMAIRMVITSNKINSNNMSEAIEEGFSKSTNGNPAPIQSKIDELVKTFSKDPIEVGNIFDLVYVPGEGVKSYKNGQLKTTIKGLDFKQALFGIWLSDNPVQSGLKNNLLGN